LASANVGLAGSNWGWAGRGELRGGKAVVLMSGEVYAIYGRYISDIFDRYIQ